MGWYWLNTCNKILFRHEGLRVHDQARRCIAGKQEGARTILSLFVGIGTMSVRMLHGHCFFRTTVAGCRTRDTRQQQHIQRKSTAQPFHGNKYIVQT